MYVPVSSVDLALLVANEDGPLASAVFVPTRDNVLTVSIAITQEFAPTISYLAATFLLGTLVAAGATPESESFKEPLRDAFKEVASEAFIDELLRLAVIVSEEGGEGSEDIPF